MIFHSKLIVISVNGVQSWEPDVAKCY